MAKDYMKGIVITIGGDTSPLTAALKQSDAALRSARGELTTINRLLKFNPENVELLEQKMTALDTSTAETKKRLDTLREAEKAAAEQFQRGDIGEAEMRDLRREIIATESKLQTLEGQTDDTRQTLDKLRGAASDAGDAVQQQGNNAEQAGKKNDALKKQVDDLKKSYDEAKSSAKDALKDVGVSGAAVGAAAVGVALLADSYQSALNTIQTATGANAEQMTGIRDAMTAVYNAGKGEDLDDVAAVFGEIVQQTRELDAGKLQQYAENTLLLRDAFDFDAKESLRAVTMLTQQFGVSAETAYTLIAQGAQNGLNRNGDLLDVVNEYSVHYKNLGYTAEEFFASLQNGAASGTFSVDKLGDAMKEFGIRTRDTAQSTTEGFTLIGLDADKMREAFAAGGDSAKNASAQTLEALFATQDAVIRNQAGVALFGTMWEDLGQSTMAALTDVRGGLQNTGKSIEELTAIKYDDTKTQWTALGRTVQTDLIVPIGEKLLPVAKKFCNFLSTNLTDLLPTINAVGTGLITALATQKIGLATAAISKLIETMKAWEAASEAVQTASTSTAIGLAAAAIGVLVGAMTALISSEEAAREEYMAYLESLSELNEEEQAAADAVSDRTAAMKALQAARQKNSAGIRNECDDLRALWEEMQTVVGVNGEIKDGYEERADMILGTLNGALGTEYEIVDGVLQKYDEINSSISEQILLLQARNMLESGQAEYDSARADATALTAEYADARDALAQAQAEYETKIAAADEKARYAAALKAYESYDPNYIPPEVEQELRDASAAVENARLEADALAVKIVELQDSKNAAYENLTANRTTIENYEALQTASVSGDSAGIQAAMVQYQYGYQTTATANQEQLDAQVTELKGQLQQLIDLQQESPELVNQRDIDDLTALLTTAVADANGFSAEYAAKYVDNLVRQYAGETDVAVAKAGGPVQITGKTAYSGMARRYGNVMAYTDSGSSSAAVAAYTRTATAASSEINGKLERVQSYVQYLQSIYTRLQQLDPQIVLDDGTIVGRVKYGMDAAIGGETANAVRSTLR